jgi:hypothetical protein
MEPHDIERIRRSVAMASPGQPSGLTREVALSVLGQLQEITTERDRLAARLDAEDLT